MKPEPWKQLDSLAYRINLSRLRSGSIRVTVAGKWSGRVSSKLFRVNKYGSHKLEATRYAEAQQKLGNKCLLPQPRPSEKTKGKTIVTAAE